jgi:sentrin-specific protease 8
VQAIAFWEEYMEHGVLSARSAARICLLRPSMVFMLMQTPDPATLKDALPPLHRFTHIFMPINDNTNPETAEGGSHWTLLLVSLIDDVAFHYDSLRPSNYEPARLATKKLEQVVGKKLTFVDIEDTPQQDNGSDCGIYVCQNMDILTREKLLETEKAKKIDMSLGQTKWDADNVRRNMVATIDDLRKKAIKIESRSRSRSREPSTQPPRIGPGSNAADS